MKKDIIFPVIAIIIGVLLLTGVGSVMRCGWICNFL